MNINIANTININNSIKQTNFSSNRYLFSKTGKTQDKLSFKGLSISPVANKKEIDELVDLFYASFVHNLNLPKSSFNILNKLDKFIATLPFRLTAKGNASINEVFKSDNKIVGGYSMLVNKLKQTAHIGLITLSPEYMRTKEGAKMLKQIGKRIYENAEVNGIKEFTWSTNNKNKQVNILLKRFNAEKVKSFGSESEYKITLENFKNVIENF